MTVSIYVHLRNRCVAWESTAMKRSPGQVKQPVNTIGSSIEDQDLKVLLASLEYRARQYKQTIEKRLGVRNPVRIVYARGPILAA